MPWIGKLLTGEKDFSRFEFDSDACSLLSVDGDELAFALEGSSRRLVLTHAKDSYVEMTPVRMPRLLNIRCVELSDFQVPDFMKIDYPDMELEIASLLKSKDNLMNPYHTLPAKALVLPTVTISDKEFGEISLSCGGVSLSSQKSPSNLPLLKENDLMKGVYFNRKSFVLCLHSVTNEDIDTLRKAYLILHNTDGFPDLPEVYEKKNYDPNHDEEYMIR